MTVARAEYEAAESAWNDHEPVPQVWTSGSWSLEHRGDALCDLRFDGSLVAQQIRCVARDSNWQTVPSRCTSFVADERGFALMFRLDGLGAAFGGELSVSADETSLSLRMLVVSEERFLRNRLGLTILHQAALAGSPIVVHHTSQERTATTFPDSIAPHQPAQDIAGLEWEYDGLSVTARFGGEIFEMEDQRNWTDASFKTYSTPLAEPFPQLVQIGDVVEQQISFTVERNHPISKPRSSSTAQLRRTHALVPEFGLGASSGPVPVPRLAAHPAFLLVELDLPAGDWRTVLERAIAEADGVPLDVRVVALTPKEVELAVNEVRRRQSDGVLFVRLGVFSRESHLTTPALWDSLVQAAAGLELELVGGTRAHFTELNRSVGRLPETLQSTTFSSTPQMHATERSQVVAAIGIQRLTALTAVKLSEGRPVHVGPVTLRPRFNAVATTTETLRSVHEKDGYGPDLWPAATDLRQGSRALAAWTIASAAAFSVRGVSSVCFFEASGPRGIVDVSGESFFVASAFDALVLLSGRPLLEAEGLPDAVSVLACEDNGLVRILASNLGGEQSQFTVSFAASRIEVALGPYEWALLSFP